jgi:hypothetical protein
MHTAMAAEHHDDAEVPVVGAVHGYQNGCILHREFLWKRRTQSAKLFR